jgi:hypothetical protein
MNSRLPELDEYGDEMISSATKTKHTNFVKRRRNPNWSAKKGKTPVKRPI